ncbi:MAG TPA: PIN domain-containing protein [Thermodesulfovibrionia bacterium]|nr:PIN domain-containing protein [Thermodesulfovibrionia bacterium]
MKLAYIDSCVWITRIEGLSAYRKIINANLKKLKLDGWILCASDAVVLEVLQKPYKDNNQVIISIYNKLFNQTKMLKIFKDIFKNALTVANTENLKAMDAVHVSIAIKSGCEYFVSTAPNLRSLKAIPSMWINLNMKT